jgi:STE24 endopeptidase
MTATIIFAIIVGLVCLGYALDRSLELLNLRRMHPELPERLRAFYDEDKYRRSQQYLREKGRFGLLGSTLSFAVTLVVLLTGGLGMLDGWLRGGIEDEFLLALAFFGILAAASDVLGIPFALYDTFVIEAKYGFNKTTPKTWILDKLKGLVLGATLGAGVLFIFIWLVDRWQEDFWIWFWIVITVVTLLFQFLYTSVLLPIFNKLKPLEDGELRAMIQTYSSKVAFPLDNILVMDGSKRSTKANAFFSGFGSRKRIVLFDTLIAQMTPQEILAVLAHEVGHYKRRHIMQGLVIGVLNMGLILFILSRLISAPALSEALGATQPGIHMSLVAFALLFSPISRLTGLGMNLLSRKNEYEADAFARETYAAQPLESALIKLHVENLSNLDPHPAYVFVHYSHPTLLQRIANLRA